MATKPNIPKGTRDFSPEEMTKRNYIFNTIRSVYRLYGYNQIETPAMENLSTLMGKYGEEGDKLLFKILNSGNFLSNVPPADLSEPNPNKLASFLCEKGLRYDLTVPFARYVVQHREELNMPFKRFQIQPVWRADKPQKGRYREFYQCDADVVGSTSLINEAELLQIADTVFSKLGIRVLIKLNNRKILTGIAETIGEANKLTPITVAIDKLDKIGLDAVNAELARQSLSNSAIEKLQPFILMKGSNTEKISAMRQALKHSETGMKGLDECEFVLNTLAELSLKNTLSLDLTLARGLNYYTGCIFEIKAADTEIGSIAGGGRYDNLTGIFGLPDLSGVGISFGADRIYDVLSQLNLFPQASADGTQILFVNFGPAEAQYCLKTMTRLRAEGIACEIYPDHAKMKKQMSYANAKSIPFVALAGENEIGANKLTLKNMTDGKQLLLDVDEVINYLKKATPNS